MATTKKLPRKRRTNHALGSGGVGTLPTWHERNVAKAKTFADMQQKTSALAEIDGTHPPPPPPPLTGKQWDEANFPPPIKFLGPWNSGTRAMFTMDTGLGKSHWSLALGLAISHGKEFCGWQPNPESKPRVLYIEGEMSKHEVAEYVRLQAKALDIKWLKKNDPFILINWETETIPPLNTKAGHWWVFKKIAEFKPDFIIFDNIFCLTNNHTASAKGWINEVVEPLMMEIARRGIGQLWIQHTGKSGKVQHGTKAREFRLTINLIGQRMKDRGIGFNLRWVKRRGDDGTNDDYADKFVSFEGGIWDFDLDIEQPLSTGPKIGRPNESVNIAIDALVTCVDEAEDETGREDTPISTSVWKAKCIEFGISPGGNTDSANKAFVRARKHLLETKQIVKSPDGYHPIIKCTQYGCN
jgi:hypothetical protein